MGLKKMAQELRSRFEKQYKASQKQPNRKAADRLNVRIRAYESMCKDVRNPSCFTRPGSMKA